MQTVSFQTRIKNRTIEIPEEYSHFAFKHVKVVLSVDGHSTECPSTERTTDHTVNNAGKVHSMSLNTKSFRFDRQEANQR